MVLRLKNLKLRKYSRRILRYTQNYQRKHVLSLWHDVNTKLEFLSKHDLLYKALLIIWLILIMGQKEKLFCNLNTLLGCLNAL